MLIEILFVITLLVLFMWRDTKKPKGFPPGMLNLISAFNILKQINKTHNYF